MNARAAELGMENTVFVNCTGLPAEGHHSSAYDIALMSRALIQNHPDIRTYTTIWMDTLRDGTFQLANTNKLIRFYEGATGLKTGSTDAALYCVSATAEKDGMELIAVVLGSPTSADRFETARRCSTTASRDIPGHSSPLRAHLPHSRHPGHRPTACSRCSPRRAKFSFPRPRQARSPPPFPSRTPSRPRWRRGRSWEASLSWWMGKRIKSSPWWPKRRSPG